MKKLILVLSMSSSPALGNCQDLLSGCKCYTMAETEIIGRALMEKCHEEKSFWQEPVFIAGGISISFGIGGLIGYLIAGK